MADKALLVGINNYESISPLSGCLNDVANLKTLLKKDFGFSESNIEQLVEEDAIYSNIEDSLMSMIQQAEEGDRLVFHFSGHGSFIDSENDDEAMDELICLHNMDWDDPDSYLVDDDIGALLEDVKPGVCMTVILDACHSGSGTKAFSAAGRSVKNPSAKSRLLIINDAQKTMTKGLARNIDVKSNQSNKQLIHKDATPPVARFVLPPPSIQQRITAAKLNRVGEHLADDDYNHQLLAGADAIQTAADAYIDGMYQGAFTYHLCSSSRELGEGVSTLSVFANAKSKMLTAGFHQTPQLEGIRKQDRLFGGEATEDADLSDRIATDRSSTQVFADLIRVQEKFLDLSSQVLGLERRQT